MASRITVTKKELAALRDAASFTPSLKLESLLAKAEAAHAGPLPDTSDTSDGSLTPALAALEAAFLQGAKRMGTPLGKLGKKDVFVLLARIKEVGATTEDALLLGSWIAKQQWLRTAVNLSTVLRKWPDWASQARAAAPRQVSKAPAPLGGVTYPMVIVDEVKDWDDWTEDNKAPGGRFATRQDAQSHPGPNPGNQHWPGKAGPG